MIIMIDIYLHGIVETITIRLKYIIETCKFCNDYSEVYLHFRFLVLDDFVVCGSFQEDFWWDDLLILLEHDNCWL